MKYRIPTSRNISQMNQHDNRVAMSENADILFFIALFLLNIVVWLSRMDAMYGVPRVVKYILAIYVLSVFFLRRLRFKQSLAFNPAGPIIIWFFVYTCYIIISSIRPEVFYVQELLADPYFMIPYFIPLLLLLTRFDAKFFRTVLKFSSRILPLSLIILLYFAVVTRSSGNWAQIGPMIMIFDVFSLLLLLTCHLLRRPIITYLVVTYRLALLYIVSSNGRRGGFVLISLSLIVTAWIRLRSSSLDPAKKFAIIMGIIMFAGICSITQGQWRQLAVFQRGLDREAFEGTRGQVFEDFFNDFKGLRDYTIGRGLNGRISRTIRGEETGSNIENGYLSVLFRTGLLYLVPMLMIFVFSAYLGYFKSNNDLSKALAIILALQFVRMVSFGLPAFSSFYVLIWVAASAGFNFNLRMLRNCDLGLDSYRDVGQSRRLCP